MKYVYPSVFHPEIEGGYSVYFPDVKCGATQGDSIAECIDMAEDFLGLALYSFEFLKEVDSLALCNAQKNLETAYKNFFRDPTIGFPNFKSKRNDRKSYTTNCVNNNIRIDGRYIILPKAGRVKLKQHRIIPSDYSLKSVTVSQNAAEKYYVSLLYEYKNTAVLKEIKSVIGLDFSMIELYIDSDGNHAEYPR